MHYYYYGVENQIAEKGMPESAGKMGDADGASLSCGAQNLLKMKNILPDRKMFVFLQSEIWEEIPPNI